MQRLCIVATLALIMVVANAAEAPQQSDGNLKPEVAPEVRIMNSERGLITEYRIKGHLYMSKIQPIVGPPYYLFDQNSDGKTNVRQNENWHNNTPQWKLLTW